MKSEKQKLIELVQYINQQIIKNRKEREKTEFLLEHYKLVYDKYDLDPIDLYLGKIDGEKEEIRIVDNSSDRSG